MCNMERAFDATRTGPYTPTRKMELRLGSRLELALVIISSVELHGSPASKHFYSIGSRDPPGLKGVTARGGWGMM